MMDLSLKFINLALELIFFIQLIFVEYFELLEEYRVVTLNSFLKTHSELDSIATNGIYYINEISIESIHVT